MGLYPAASFTVPSIHDDIDLECRIYHPKDNLHPPARGAIFAHPYAPLGGCFDDPVVISVVSVLVRKGYVVGTFNFRGAGNSKGRTSWTSRPELSDYVTFVGFFLSYLNQLSWSGLESSNAATAEAAAATAGHTLLLGGYSYGALLTIQLPLLQAIINRFDQPAAGSAEAEIRLRAIALAKEHRLTLTRGRKRRSLLSPGSPTPVHGGEESEPGARRISRDSKRSMEGLRRSMDRSKRKLGHKPASEEHLPPSPPAELPHQKIAAFSVQFLLISPILPPVAWFIALSTPGLANLSGHAQSPKPGEDDKLYRNDTLALYGDKDTFTSAKRLRKWSEQLKGMDGSRFRSQEMAGRGHFWMDDSAAEQLRAAVEAWTAIGPVDQEGNQMRRMT